MVGSIRKFDFEGPERVEEGRGGEVWLLLK